MAAILENGGHIEILRGPRFFLKSDPPIEHLHQICCFYHNLNDSSDICNYLLHYQFTWDFREPPGIWHEKFPTFMRILPKLGQNHVIEQFKAPASVSIQEVLKSPAKRKLSITGRVRTSVLPSKFLPAPNLLPCAICRAFPETPECAYMCFLHSHV